MEVDPVMDCYLTTPFISLGLVCLEVDVLKVKDTAGLKATEYLHARYTSDSPDLVLQPKMCR